MPDKLVSLLRTFAATAITCSGIGHIAALWLRELTETALLDALLGAVYLIIGIGLYGQSRFTLFMAIIVPGCMAAFMLYSPLNPGPVDTLRITTDLVIALSSLLVLWQVRNNPSV
jgi:hypothetical protein